MSASHGATALPGTGVPGPVGRAGPAAGVLAARPPCPGHMICELTAVRMDHRPNQPRRGTDPSPVGISPRRPRKQIRHGQSQHHGQPRAVPPDWQCRLVFVEVAGVRALDGAHMALEAQCPVILRRPRPSVRKSFSLTCRRED